MDDVQTGEIMGRRGHCGGSRIRVVPSKGGISAGIIRASVGRSWAISLTWQVYFRGCGREVAAVKLGQNCSICRSPLQVPLLAELEGCVQA
jgi:hypothetical protein